MSYKPFIPDVTGFVTGLLPVKEETGYKLLPEVEAPLVTGVTDVTGKRVDTYAQLQKTCEDQPAQREILQKGGHVSETGYTVTNAVFPEVERVTGAACNRLQNRLQESCTVADRSDTPPADRAPLPRDKWVTGIATFAEARRVQLDLKQQHLTALGLGEEGYYVACPDSGLCKAVNG